MAELRRGNDFDDLFGAVADACDDAIIVKDLDGNIRSWNLAAQRLYGYSADEAVGRPISLIVPPDRAAEYDAIMQRVRNDERVDRYETVRRAKDGHLVDVSLIVVPIHNAKGEVVAAGAIARDLATRKQADLALQSSEARRRISESRWQSVIESAVDGIIVIDARGRIEAINPAAERLFGYAAREVVGRNVNVLMPSPYREEHDGYLARYLSTHERKIIGVGREVMGQRKDGSTFPAHLSVGEIHAGGERKFTGILHDLSARTRMEGQLREQTALARLGEMAAVIAHEVRNPLAGIRGALQIIGKRLSGGSREADVMVEVIARIDGLNSLLQDLLLFARPPQPRFAPVDVAALIAKIVELLTSDPAHHELLVTIDGSSPMLDADPDLLKVVFENLLVNGAQAMQGRGSMRVSLTSAGRQCQVVIADSGPGIPPDVQDRIFKPFFTTKARGTGLGLPTAKRLIEAHGGQIHVACPPQGGTAVTVELPIEAAH